MAKVITTLAAEDGLNFNYICSFKTESCIGIWNYANDNFMLVNKSDIKFRPYFIPNCKNLEELDKKVYDACDEHITEVFKDSGYTFTLDV